jgi:hypothetical protein
MLDMDHLAGDACCLRRLGDGAKSFLGVFLHAYFVLSRRVLEHLRVGREHMKGRQDRQRGGFAPIRLAKAMPSWTSFPGNSDPSVGIRMWVYIVPSSDLTSPAARG